MLLLFHPKVALLIAAPPPPEGDTMPSFTCSLLRRPWHHVLQVKYMASCNFVL